MSSPKSEVESSSFSEPRPVACFSRALMLAFDRNLASTQVQSSTRLEDAHGLTPFNANLAWLLLTLDMRCPTDFLERSDKSSEVLADRFDRSLSVPRISLSRKLWRADEKDEGDETYGKK